MTTIQITGLDAVLRKLQKVENVAAVMDRPMKQALGHLQRRLARYPRKASGAFTAMATPAQKRAYWAKVRGGEISHDPRTGYRRSGTIGRKWTTQIKRGTTHITGIVGNNAPGAIYVQGSKQQPFHKASGWPTTDSVAESEAAAVRGYFHAEIRRIGNS